MFHSHISTCFLPPPSLLHYYYYAPQECWIPHPNSFPFLLSLSHPPMASSCSLLSHGHTFTKLSVTVNTHNRFRRTIWFGYEDRITFTLLINDGLMTRMDPWRWLVAIMCDTDGNDGDYRRTFIISPLFIWRLIRIRGVCVCFGCRHNRALSRTRWIPFLTSLDQMLLFLDHIVSFWYDIYWKMSIVEAEFEVWIRFSAIEDITRGHGVEKESLPAGRRTWALCEEGIRSQCAK